VENTIGDIPQLSDEETSILSAHFVEKEVDEAIIQMEKNKSPNGAEFYQTFWEVIKNDLMKLFQNSNKGICLSFK
jgi:hypothetical protein